MYHVKRVVLRHPARFWCSLGGPTGLDTRNWRRRRGVFSPEEACTVLAVDAIDRAETQILVNAYALTTSSSAVEALIRAKQRGVEVKLIADRTTPCGHNSGVGSLARAGIPIWIDHSARIATPNP